MKRVEEGAGELVVSKANHHEQGTGEGRREGQAKCE
jgi:hypothetical protein